MADYRTVKTSMWAQDEWFMDLPIDGKLLWIYVFTNSHTSVAGIYKLPMRTIVFETGLERGRIQELLKLFGKEEKAFYEDGVIWVCKMRDHQATSSDLVFKRIRLDVNALPDTPLKQKYCFRYGMHTVSIPYLQNLSDTDTDTDTVTDTETEKETEERGAFPPDLLASNSRADHDLLTTNSGVAPGLGFATGSKPRQKLVEKHSARNGTLDPKIRLPLVDSLLDVYGLTAMVNAGEDQRLQEMHDQAVLFHGMGYTTAGDIQALGAQWYEIDWRGQRGAQPTPKQFVEFASKRAVKQSPLIAVTYMTTDPITGEQAEQIVMERAK